jgi:hypothetical protein
MHETCVIGFLKQLCEHCKVVQYPLVYFTYMYFKNFHFETHAKQNVSILQSITTHFEYTHIITIACIHFTSSILLKISLVKN